MLFRSLRSSTLWKRYGRVSKWPASPPRARQLSNRHRRNQSRTAAERRGSNHVCPFLPRVRRPAPSGHQGPIPHSRSNVRFRYLLLTPCWTELGSPVLAEICIGHSHILAYGCRLAMWITSGCAVIRDLSAQDHKRISPVIKLRLNGPVPVLLRRKSRA